MIRIPKAGTGRGRELWPVVALLVLTVVVPTACVLWFMTKAIANERLAVRQRLGDAYRTQLAAVRTQLQSRWRDRVDALSSLDAARPGTERFAAIVRSGLADSAVLHDTAGHPVYPSLPGVPHETTAQAPPAWSGAEKLEYRLDDPAAADGSEEERLQAFRRIRDGIEEFVRSLPWELEHYQEDE